MDTAYEPTEMELSKSPRRTPSPPLLSPCEQLRHNKAQLKRMITFRKHKAACIQELQAMPDHHPEDLSEFEFPPLRKTARKINLDLSQSVDDNLISTNKFALPENNLENPGLDSQTEIDQEVPNSPAQNGPAAPSNQNTAQDTPTLPPPVMLKITDHVKNHMILNLKHDILNLDHDSPENI
ncbi:hypothetical protein TNCT_249071 [Trichonephila clavata]|uniref:Uncharacterized protein n=1 Tax=Trichonephila clavata TaxID=2740835 RepID=A0A8X6KSZ2_TRICU|nr:hypothetical protein TNCT_249071 [Trichonephila clavata]